MIRKEFEKYIKTIGFKSINSNGDYSYKYKGCEIDLYDDHYDFFNGSEWTLRIPFNDLTQLEKEFKRELRSIKLKQLLR